MESAVSSERRPSARPGSVWINASKLDRMRGHPHSWLVVLVLGILTSGTKGSLSQNCSEYYDKGGQSSKTPDAARWCSEGTYWTFPSPSNAGQNVSLFTRCTAGADLTSDDGKTVLISHGFPTSTFDWMDVVAELEGNGFRTCAVDYVGFGFSEKPRAPFVYSMFDQAAALHAFATSKGITNFTLATHDSK